MRAAPTGRFTGTVPTVHDDPANATPPGGLRVTRDDVLTVTYADALTDEGGTATLTDDATIGGGANGTLTIVATVPGEDASVTIVGRRPPRAPRPFDVIVTGPGNGERDGAHDGGARQPGHVRRHRPHRLRPRPRPRPARPATARSRCATAPC